MFDTAHHSLVFEIPSSLGFWFSSFPTCHFPRKPPCLFPPIFLLFNIVGPRTIFGSLLSSNYLTPLVMSYNLIALNSVFMLMTLSSELTFEFQIYRCDCFSYSFIQIFIIGITSLNCPSHLLMPSTRPAPLGPLHMLFL